MLALLRAKILNADYISCLIIDEADLMAREHYSDVNVFTKFLRTTRHTIMTSVTWSFEARSLAEEILTNPIQVSVGSLCPNVNVAIEQIVKVVSGEEEKKRVIFFFK